MARFPEPVSVPAPSCAGSMARKPLRNTLVLSTIISKDASGTCNSESPSFEHHVSAPNALLTAAGPFCARHRELETEYVCAGRLNVNRIFQLLLVCWSGLRQRLWLAQDPFLGAMESTRPKSNLQRVRNKVEAVGANSTPSTFGPGQADQSCRWSDHQL